MLKLFFKWSITIVLLAILILTVNSARYFYLHNNSPKQLAFKPARHVTNFDDAARVTGAMLGRNEIKGDSLGSSYWITDKNIATDIRDSKTGRVSQIVGGVKPVQFFRDTFLNDASFNRDLFKNDVQFRECLFKDTTIADDDETARDATFQLGSFKKSLQLRANLFQSDVSFADCRFDGKVWVDDDNQFNGHNLNFADCYFQKGIDLSISSEMIDPDNPTESLGKGAAESVTLLNNQIWGLTDLSQMKMILPRNRQVKFFDSSIDSLDLFDANLTTVLDLQEDNVKPLPHDQWWAKQPFFSFFFAPYQDSIYYDKIAMNLAGADISKINLDYSQVKLYFDASATENDINSVFLSLLKKYQKNGETENYRLVDIDYRNEEGGLENFLSKYWWYYGYEQWLIFIWSAALIIIFSLINVRWIGKIYYTYSIDNITLYHKRLSKSGDKRFMRFKKYLLCLLYTSVIFFGVRMSFDSIRFSRMGLVLFLLLQFIIGLICGGFIINLILH